MTIPSEIENEPQPARSEPGETPDSDDDDAIGAPASAPPSEPLPRDFEDLTLAEVLGQLVRAPTQTWRALAQVAQTPTRGLTMESAPTPVAPPVVVPPVRPISIPRVVSDPAARIERQRTAIKLALYLIAFLLAWWGCSILADAPLRVESEALDKGAPFLLAAFVVWLAAEAWDNSAGIKARITRNAARSTAAPLLPNPPSSEAIPTADELYRPQGTAVWTGVHPARIILAVVGTFLAVMAWQGTKGNQFTSPGFYSWIASVALWVAALAPPSWRWSKMPGQVVAKIRSIRIQWRSNWTWFWLIAIVALGMTFRLANLPGVPPEMTSDHVEKLLDAQRVLDGNHQVFFPNNGGREPFQMYAMALFSQLPGMSMNFISLKLLAMLESMVTLPVLWWMGREIIGERDPQLGNVVGLLLAALVAVSYWDVAVTRLSLRIILTPLVTALLMIFYCRALRSNRRGDFIIAGLILGFGLYTYQAVRMLPVVLAVAFLVTLIFYARDFKARWRFTLNFIALVIVAFVAFVPLFGFSLDQSVGGPQIFWQRTFGRLLGDDLIQTEDANGNIVMRNATFDERMDALKKNLPVLMDNLRNALLMFNWKGDVAWINGAPNYPAMDIFTGSLLIVGAAAWLALMVKRRDAGDWLMPIAFGIMLLPSALSIAYPIENPSATRMTGTLPEVYLFAAFPLALIVVVIQRLAAGRTGAVLASGLTAVVVLSAFASNSNTYFGPYLEAYIESSLPYTEAGRILKGFADSDGSFGNAFMLAYRYWWDARAVGLEAGLVDWPNGIPDPDGDNAPLLPADSLPRFMYDGSQRTDKYRFDPNKDILIFLSKDDQVTAARLQEWFPSGRATLIHSYQPGHDFTIYRVPWLGVDGFMEFLKHRGVVGG